MGKPHPSTTSSISEHTTSELLSLTFSISYLSFLWLFEKRTKLQRRKKKETTTTSNGDTKIG
jgi:hypothetical protein